MRRNDVVRVKIEFEDGKILEVENKNVKNLRYITTSNHKNDDNQELIEVWREYFIAWIVPLDINYLNSKKQPIMTEALDNGS